MRYILTLLLFTILSHSFSQEAIQLSGTVTDSITGEAVEYTNIYLLNNREVGTITNKDGSFTLRINQQDTVVFASISFKTAYFYAQKSTNKIEIKLHKDPIILDEVVVNPNLEALEIMSKFSNNFKENHHLKNTYYEAFVRAIESTNTELDFIEEYILHVDQSIISPKFKITKGRIKAVSKLAISSLNKQTLSSIAGMWDDYITLYLAEFLRKNKLNKYEYILQGTVKIDDNYCYHILCTEKEANTIVNLYIERTSYGIVKIDIFSTSGKYSTESELELCYINIADQWSLKSSVSSFILKNSPNTRYEKVCLYSKIKTESKEGYEGLRKTMFMSALKYKSDFKGDFWGDKKFIPLPENIKEQIE